MDLTQPILYRGFNFNTVEPSFKDVTGCSVERVSLGTVQIVGYTEKRALGDGNDATDVFLGPRRVTIMGTIYGNTRGALYDLQRAMRYAIDPRNAYLDAPYEQGYQPLYFWEPTEDTYDYPDGKIAMQLRVRAMTTVDATFERNRTGGEPESAIAVPYSVTFEAKDPLIRARVRQSVPMSGALGVATLYNRGGHPVPLNILLNVAGNTSFIRYFHFVGCGTEFDITIPKAADSAVIRIDGDAKAVTMQVGDEPEAEKLAMSFRTVTAEWPLVSPGDNDVTWTYKRDDGTDGNLTAGSLLWFREAFG